MGVRAPAYSSATARRTIAAGKRRVTAPVRGKASGPHGGVRTAGRIRVAFYRFLECPFELAARVAFPRAVTSRPPSPVDPPPLKRSLADPGLERALNSRRNRDESGGRGQLLGGRVDQRQPVDERGLRC